MKPRKYAGEYSFAGYSADGMPTMLKFEVWLSAEDIVRAVAHRVRRSKNGYAKALFGAILVKEVK